MAYLKNAWYVACYPNQVKAGEMFSRTICDDAIVMYRDSHGHPIALQDRCPHRFIPLHLGKIKGDVVECCYHGLQFDCTGSCVKNPHGDGKIPSKARVHAYPLVEKHALMWIWMGEDAADESMIPDYSVLTKPDVYRTSRGYMTIDANYELMGENLLDLSHVPYLHEGLLGSPEMACALPVIREDAGELHVDRWMPNVGVPQVFDMLYRQDGKPVDAWQNMRWNPPGAFLLDAGVVAPGQPREDAGWYFGVHILTPETSRTTHYHYAAARPVGAELDAESDKKLAALRRIAFEDQDKPIINAQQAAIGDSNFWDMKPVLLSVDVGPIRMRRMIERLIKEEEEKREAAKAQSPRQGQTTEHHG
jgi:phenylpropionate dioxygenase-like ring-hydroxylating dioxygenase large terminal subunit